MKFKIPFTHSNAEILKKRSKSFQKLVSYKKNSKLEKNLVNAGVNLDRKEYVSIAIRTALQFFVFLYIFSTTILAVLNISFFLLWGLVVSLLFASFIFFSQLVYPRIFILRRQRAIERNLLSALEDILVQLNSGIPLFAVLVNISGADYGALSEEFEKAVKKINAGSPEQEVLEELSHNNTSKFFKRTLWQISNGMNAGSNMANVVRDSIKSLNEEQLLQIQRYGNQLNPLMVFYMLAAVIIPSLSITFLTIFSSMVSLPGNSIKILFMGLFVGVVFIQIMFLGMIKSKRPSLI